MEPPNITISGISSGQVEIIFARNWSIEISERSSIFANVYTTLNLTPNLHMSKVKIVTMETLESTPWMFQRDKERW